MSLGIQVPSIHVLEVGFSGGWHTIYSSAPIQNSRCTRSLSFTSFLLGNCPDKPDNIRCQSEPHTSWLVLMNPLTVGTEA